MRLKVILAAFSVAVFLSACGKEGVPQQSVGGAGVESKSSTEVKESQSDKVSEETKFERSRSIKAGFSMPATRILNDAFMSMAFDNKIDTMAERDKLRRIPDLEILVKEEDVAFRRHMLVMLNTSFLPNSYGWPDNPFNGSNPSKSAMSLSKSMFAATYFTDQVSDMIAAKVIDQGVIRNPATAKKKVVDAWATMPIDDLKALWLTAVQTHQQQSSLGTIVKSASEGIHFSVGQYNFEQGKSGTLMTVAGAPQFGDGYINGKKIEIAMETSVGASISSSEAGGFEGSTSTGKGKDAKVAVGN